METKKTTLNIVLAINLSIKDEKATIWVSLNLHKETNKQKIQSQVQIKL